MKKTMPSVVLRSGLGAILTLLLTAGPCADVCAQSALPAGESGAVADVGHLLDRCSSQLENITKLMDEGKLSTESCSDRPPYSDPAQQSDRVQQLERELKQKAVALEATTLTVESYRRSFIPLIESMILPAQGECGKVAVVNSGDDVFRVTGELANAGEVKAKLDALSQRLRKLSERYDVIRFEVNVTVPPFCGRRVGAYLVAYDGAGRVDIWPKEKLNERFGKSSGALLEVDDQECGRIGAALHASLTPDERQGLFGFWAQRRGSGQLAACLYGADDWSMVSEAEAGEGAKFAVVSRPPAQADGGPGSAAGGGARKESGQ
jgi:hypothetical protein